MNVTTSAGLQVVGVHPPMAARAACCGSSGSILCAIVDLSEQSSHEVGIRNAHYLPLATSSRPLATPPRLAL